jgi:dTDP-4-amino-4,6-dideoxygalactose transaminase
MTSLRSIGIDCRPPWYPNHRQAMYAPEQAYDIEHADRLVHGGLHLPGSPSLRDDDQQYVVESVRRALG